ncbi:hypothetical protein HY991_03185 [Candidatus Micrarchaeota archaeon]|nr:hypothetical protein [Candidatus Micrarchaeota archaeon]
MVEGASPPQLIYKDFLGGWGDFEFAADTHWVSGYNGADYDFMKESGWTSPPNSDLWRNGVNLATENDSVAVGWFRETGSNVNPGKNIVYKLLLNEGTGGSNCQYFALKNTSAGNSVALLESVFPVDSKQYNIHPGDTVLFHVDSIRMSDYDNLPSGASVEYKILLEWSDGRVNEKKLAPSSVPFSAEIEGIPTSGETSLIVGIRVGVSSISGERQPGVCVDGAHLYIKRAGSSDFEKEVVPVPRERKINTMMIFFDANKHDPHEIAKTYDSVMLQQESHYTFAQRLKYYNPNIKVYLYESATITDWRDGYYNDSWYSNSPIGFGWAIDNHPEWFYSYPQNAGVKNPPGDNRASWKRFFNDGKTPLNYVFSFEYQNSYCTRLDDPNFQNTWRERTVDKATRYKLDGVFVDSLAEVEEFGTHTTDGSTVSVLNITPWEVQSFQHSVFPFLRASNLEIVHNLCTKHYGTWLGKIYLDPFWKPDDSIPEKYKSPNYKENSPEVTADVFFQEWAFFRHWPVNGVDMNHYEPDYWRECLKDIETVVEWNTQLPDNRKKKVHMLVHGIDRPGDPADGIDGWIYFGFCSFLLAKNDFAWFGADQKRDLIGLFNLTEKLGDLIEPRNNHTGVYADATLQTRKYSNGTVVVNGHSTLERNYTLEQDFVEESGKRYSAGTNLTLKPHTGRILFNPPQNPVESCGNGICDSSENCNSCPVDCGVCPCTNCGGGGDGGGPPSGGTGGGVASQTSSLSTSTSLQITSTTQECTSGESKCVESSAGKFLFECVGGAWKTQKECRVGCTKVGVGGECKLETNETLANAYGRVLAEVNSLLADAKAAGLNISAEELDLRKASEFKDRGDYSNAVDALEKAKKSIQEKLAELPPQQLLELSQQRIVGLSGAALALIFLAYAYRKRKRREEEIKNANISSLLSQKASR